MPSISNTSRPSNVSQSACSEKQAEKKLSTAQKASRSSVQQAPCSDISEVPKARGVAFATEVIEQEACHLPEERQSGLIRRSPTPWSSTIAGMTEEEFFPRRSSETGVIFELDSQRSSIHSSSSKS